MDFARSDVLWLLIAVPAAVALSVYAARRRDEAVRLFLGRTNEAEAMRMAAVARGRRARAALVTAALGFVVVALAGPQVGRAVREARGERLDLVVVLDLSRSMLAEDVPPSRLERAKAELARLVETRRGDRLGLVVFAGDAFLQCPLTTDRGAFRLFLDAAAPDLMPTPGSDLGRALDVAHAALATEEDEAPRSRAVLVVSDGEDHGGEAERAARDLRADGVALLVAGVGTAEGGSIPIRSAGRRTGTWTDREGREVTTRLDERVLGEIAGRDGVVPLAPGAGAAPILAARLDRMERTTGGAHRVEAAAERFQWPLALGLLLLVVERLVALSAGVGARERVST